MSTRRILQLLLLVALICVALLFSQQPTVERSGSPSQWRVLAAGDPAAQEWMTYLDRRLALTFQYWKPWGLAEDVSRPDVTLASSAKADLLHFIVRKQRDQPASAIYSAPVSVQVRVGDRKATAYIFPISQECVFKQKVYTGSPCSQVLVPLQSKADWYVLSCEKCVKEDTIAPMFLEFLSRVAFHQ